VDAWVQGNKIDIGWGLMILTGMTSGDTTILGFLAETSCINVADNVSLMVLPGNMTSFGSLGHLGKGLFVLYNWCSSSSSNFEVVDDL
jgi:hypothetical protein